MAPITAHMSRRDAIAASAAFGALFTLGLRAPTTSAQEAVPMSVACFIRYQIDPFQRDAFATYASNWGKIIPRLGGRLIGYFLPWEGTNDIAWGLIGFDSLASYESYRARLRKDPEARANFTFAQEKRLVLREERTFLETVGA